MLAAKSSATTGESILVLIRRTCFQRPPAASLDASEFITPPTPDILVGVVHADVFDCFHMILTAGTECSTATGDR
jgi:hypothetical protein